MIKRRFICLCLMLLFCWISVSGGGQETGVTSGRNCLAPFLKPAVRGVLVDKPTTTQIHEGYANSYYVFRAKGNVFYADMRREYKSLIIKNLYFGTDATREKAQNEIQIFSDLASNPLTARYLPQLYSIERQQYNAYIIMEDLLDGPKPFIAMEKKDVLLKLRLCDRLAVMRELLRAVDAFHAAGYLHHDLDPRNIFYRLFLAADGTVRAQVKIIDFEYSYRLDNGEGLHAPGYQNSAEEIAVMSKEDIVAKNIYLDVNRLAESLLFLFAPDGEHDSSSDIRPVNKILALRLDLRRSYMNRLKTIHNEKLQELLIQMLLPLGLGRYPDLSSVIARIDEISADVAQASKVLINPETKTRIHKGILDGIIYRAQGSFIGADNHVQSGSLIIKERDIEIDSAQTDFDREAEISIALASNPATAPYVPAVYEVRREGDFGTIIMEDLQGGKNDFRLLTDIDGLDFQHKIIILRELTRAVAAFHSIGFVHHDLKPENIFYRLITDPDGTVRAEIKLIDYEFSISMTQPLEMGMFEGEEDGDDSWWFLDDGKRTQAELKSMTESDIIAENIGVEIHYLGASFLALFANGRSQDFSPEVRADIEKIWHGESEYLVQLAKVDNFSLQQLIIRMLMSEGKGQYKNLDTILFVLDSIASNFVSESAVSSAA